MDGGLYVRAWGVTRASIREFVMVIPVCKAPVCEDQSSGLVRLHSTIEMPMVDDKKSI